MSVIDNIIEKGFVDARSICNLRYVVGSAAIDMAGITFDENEDKIQESYDTYDRTLNLPVGTTSYIVETGNASADIIHIYGDAVGADDELIKHWISSYAREPELEQTYNDIQLPCLNNYGFIRRELTNTIKQNAYTLFLVVLPQQLVAFALFIILNASRVHSFEMSNIAFLVLFLAAAVIVIPVHEILHGVAYAIFNQKHFHSITFGVIGINPYCSNKEILTVWKTMICKIVPFIITGIIPFVVAIILNSYLIYVISLYCSCICLSDITTFIRLLYEKPKSLAMESANKSGVYIYDNNIQ